MIGTIHGRLTVISINPVRSKNRGIRYDCLCVCGKQVTVLGTSLRGGVLSCGCLRVDLFIERNTTHKLCGSELYSKWSGMIQRCTNENANKYDIYGGRGVSIIKEWRDDFYSFYCWAIKNGWEPSLVIDRKNTKGNYSPDNCRFTTVTENNKNLSTSKKWIVFGLSFDSLSMAGRYFNVAGTTIKRWCDGYITSSGNAMSNKDGCYSANKYEAGICL